jgi:hypothetical protein
MRSSLTSSQRHVASHHKRRREVSQDLYALSQQLAAPAAPARSSSNRGTWDIVWRQCCRAAAGVISSAGCATADESFVVPPFAERSSYWVAFGFAGGSPDDACPSALAAAALAGFCEHRAAEVQGIFGSSSAGYPFCSTFLAVAAAVFDLIGLVDMHRHMAVLDSPSDPPLLKFLCRAGAADGVQTAVFELCFTAMQLFDFLWLSHHAHPSQLDSITKMTVSLLVQTCEASVTSIEGFRSRLSTLAACLPNVALHLHLPDGVML